MNRFKFLTVAALTTIFVSCSDSKSTVESAKEEQTKTEAQQNNDFSSGIHTATLPCADCMGIETYITFQQDNKAVKSTSYLDSDGTSENEYGTWTKNDDIIEVSISDSPKEYYLVKPDKTLVRLDADKKEVSGEFAKNYIFKEVNAYTPAQLNGTYNTNAN